MEAEGVFDLTKEQAAKLETYNNRIKNNPKLRHILRNPGSLRHKALRQNVENYLLKNVFGDVENPDFRRQARVMANDLANSDIALNMKARGQSGYSNVRRNRKHRLENYFTADRTHSPSNIGSRVFQTKENIKGMPEEVNKRMGFPKNSTRARKLLNLKRSLAVLLGGAGGSLLGMTGGAKAQNSLRRRPVDD